jgi:hypothetical protein
MAIADVAVVIDREIELGKGIEKPEDGTATDIESFLEVFDRGACGTSHEINGLYNFNDVGTVHTERIWHWEPPREACGIRVTIPGTNWAGGGKRDWRGVMKTVMAA